jgi:CO/xanthine dehydrogenase Mo-binding subunit
VLEVGRVRFIGEKGAAIAAETRATAEQAARLVQVDYEELPAVFDAESALRGDVLIHDPAAGYEDAPASWRKAPNVQFLVTQSHGNVERAFAEAEHVIEHEFRTQAVHQAISSPTPTWPGQTPAAAFRFSPRTRCQSGLKNCLPHSSICR